MNGYRAGRNLAAAFFLSVMLAVIAPTICGGQTPGVTDDEILIGCTADLSGPIAFMGKGGVAGVRLYLSAFNERGGVYGRKIRYLVEDDGYQSPRALQAARKLVTRDGVFIMSGVLGAVQASAMYPFLASQGIPLVAPATQARQLAIPPRRYLFLSETTYTTLGKVAVEYFVREMGMDTPSIACIYQDDTPGHDWLSGVRIAAGHFGIDVLNLPYRRGAVDFSSQIARCKDAGISHVTMFTIIREPAMILKEAQRQQYRAVFITSHSSMGSTVLDLAGDAVEYSNGLYGFGVVYDFGSEDPAMLEYKSVATAYNVEYEDFMHLYGYMGAAVLAEGLRRAGKNLTRNGLISALESFDNYTPGIRPPITWGPNLRDGCRAVGVGMARDGAWVSLLPEGQWIYSFLEEH